MLALSPSLFSTYGWSIEESLLSHETTTDDHQSLLDDQYYLSQPPAKQPTSEPLHAFTSSGTVDHQVPNNNNKKLNHNASERHRRKKINCLYSSLRSLLPFDDQKKKLSVPATVARVTKYIPELQEEVERLVQKKEDLCARLSGHGNRVVDHHHHDQEKQLRRKLNHTSSCAVSATRISETEVVVQISTSKMHRNPLLMSHIINSLEEDGLVLINASSFESFGGMIILHNLHLQVERSYKLESAILRDKLLSLHEKGVYLFP